MKVRILIEYDEDIGGGASTRWAVIHPIDFPVGPATTLGILEITKNTILDPDESEAVEVGESPEFDEFRRKINSVIDEFGDSF